MLFLCSLTKLCCNETESQNVQGGSNMTGTDLYVNRDTLPYTVVGVCGEFQRTGRFLQRGI